jgi:uncharacterized protein YjbJ (UPF0337 family)
VATGVVKARRHGQQNRHQHKGEATMGFMDKLRNRFQMGKGRAKENAGRATGDPYLESKGQAERVEGAGRQVGEQVKDAGKNMRDAFKE